MEGPGKGSYAQIHLLSVQLFTTLHRPSAILFPTEAAVSQPASLCAAREDLGTGTSTDRDRAFVRKKCPCPEDCDLEGTPGNTGENVD